MPQTEILIHIVLDLDEQQQRQLRGDLTNAVLAVLDQHELGGDRLSIELRDATPEEPQAADAAEAAAPAPVGADPAGDAPISADLPADGTPIPGELPEPAAPPTTSDPRNLT